MVRRHRLLETYLVSSSATGGTRSTTRRRCSSTRSPTCSSSASTRASGTPRATRTATRSPAPTVPSSAPAVPLAELVVGTAAPWCGSPTPTRTCCATSPRSASASTRGRGPRAPRVRGHPLGRLVAARGGCRTGAGRSPGAARPARPARCGPRVGRARGASPPRLAACPDFSSPMSPTWLESIRHPVRAARPPRPTDARGHHDRRHPARTAVGRPHAPRHRPPARRRARAARARDGRLHHRDDRVRDHGAPVRHRDRPRHVHPDRGSRDHGVRRRGRRGRAAPHRRRGTRAAQDAPRRAHGVLRSGTSSPPPRGASRPSSPVASSPGCPTARSSASGRRWARPSPVPAAAAAPSRR